MFDYELPAGVTVRVVCDREPMLLRTMLGTPGSDRAPDVTLRLGRFAGAGDRITGSYKGVAWRCRIDRGAPSWDIAFDARAFAPYLAFHIALLPVLRRVVAARGGAVAPASAIVRDGERVLVLGGTASGKTTLMLRAIERGWRPVGDEYVALEDDGTMRPLFRGVALRSGVASTSPRAWGALTDRDRALVRLFALTRLASGKRLQPLLHVPWERLGMQQELSAQITHVWRLDAASATARELTADDVVGHVRAHLAAHDLAYGDPLSTSSAAPDADRSIRNAVRGAELRSGTAAQAASAFFARDGRTAEAR